MTAKMKDKYPCQEPGWSLSMRDFIVKYFDRVRVMELGPCKVDWLNRYFEIPGGLWTLLPTEIRREIIMKLPWEDLVNLSTCRDFRYGAIGGPRCLSGLDLS